MRQKLRDRVRERGGVAATGSAVQNRLGLRDENEVRKSVTGFQSRRSLGESKVDVEV